MAGPIAMDDQRPGGDAFLSDGGEAIGKIRNIDWNAHPLGPVARWPEALKIALGMALSSRFPKGLVWGESKTFFYNDAFRPILGEKPESMGRPFDEVWAEAWPVIGPIYDKAMAGEATFIEDFPVTINRHGYPEDCHFTFCYSPVRDGSGRVCGMIDTVIETTAKVQTERRMIVQNAELAHRIRNTLAIVSGVARQSLRHADSTDAAWTVLSGRLSALAQTHDLLMGGAVPEAEVSEIVAAALRPHVGEDPRISLRGPAVRLPERKALALSLAINELATNSVKHGALSLPDGRVAIEWSGDLGEAGWLSWTDSGGPPVAPPVRKGFGSTLLEQVVPQDFGATGTLDYRREGLMYRLEVRD
jgi:two-component sensor histidine kinase